MAEANPITDNTAELDLTPETHADAEDEAVIRKALGRRLLPPGRDNESLIEWPVRNRSLAAPLVAVVFTVAVLVNFLRLDAFETIKASDHHAAYLHAIAEALEPTQTGVWLTADTPEEALRNADIAAHTYDQHLRWRLRDRSQLDGHPRSLMKILPTQDVEAMPKELREAWVDKSITASEAKAGELNDVNTAGKATWHYILLSLLFTLAAVGGALVLLVLLVDNGRPFVPITGKRRRAALQTLLADGLTAPLLFTLMVLTALANMDVGLKLTNWKSSGDAAFTFGYLWSVLGTLAIEAVLLTVFVRIGWPLLRAVVTGRDVFEWRVLRLLTAYRTTTARLSTYLVQLQRSASSQSELARVTAELEQLQAVPAQAIESTLSDLQSKRDLLKAQRRNGAPPAVTEQTEADVAEVCEQVEEHYKLLASAMRRPVEDGIAGGRLARLPVRKVQWAICAAGILAACLFTLNGLFA